MFAGPEGPGDGAAAPSDGPAAPGGFRGFFGPAGPPPAGEEGDFEDGDFGPDGGPQGGLGSFFGFGPQAPPPPGEEGGLVLTASLMSNPVVAWRSSLVARIKVVTCLRGWMVPKMVKVRQ